jgi:hypothetical protein
MARKTKPAAPARRRVRRTDEQLIRDLEARVQAIRERAAARSIKRSPSMRHAVAALRAIDKALEGAAGEGNATLRRTLADARGPLAAYLSAHGVSPPRKRRPRAR